MKKSLLTLATVLLAVAAQAQTAFKVHGNGQISLQSATTSYGIQIPSNGVASFQPNITTAYGTTAKTVTRHLLAKAWEVNHNGPSLLPVPSSFFVTGNGNVYAYGSYLAVFEPRTTNKNYQPIEKASEIVSMMDGYYLDTEEFNGIEPEEIEKCENVSPEAVEGILRDMELGRTAGLIPRELEGVLPEAVRHDPNGLVGINYNAVVAVLVEAFKEQQKEIEAMRKTLETHGLMETKNR